MAYYVATVRDRAGEIEYTSPPCATRRAAEALAQAAVPHARRIMTSRTDSEGNATTEDTRFALRLGDDLWGDGEGNSTPSEGDAEKP
jgi:hypothetical protein